MESCPRPSRAVAPGASALGWPQASAPVAARTGSIAGMDTPTAVRRWADTWRENWITRSAEPIAALYASSGRYATAPFREPRIGPPGAIAYLEPVFAEEADIRCWFGEPIADGDRAAVQWWANFVENGEEVTYAGTSNLRFDSDGLTVDQWDSWNRAEGRLEPPDGWGKARP